MTKTIKIALATTVSIFLLTGCTGSDVKTAEPSASKTELTLQSHVQTKKLHEAIMRAGEKLGLKMTKFKSNAIIVEKMNGSDSASATIRFDNESVTIDRESGDIGVDALFKAIDEELQDNSHH